ncbi:DNA cytosine methyltransferase [Mesorhizobium sp. M7A.F.Ca.MR.362.00.0.0]|uniref:DNA cytosine methyltransferase n=1 Tax=Mesorhizobium sp. M7A.F.Ca.MR.362.00.0.0 TaxID=2496779 RepID=UPI000FD3452C|nr:DNA cytosine methyltransferase [Mesorhizobium sp. M7A.F.Ca.MR.362.00.0.0]RUU79995.1 DNA cytosine methyltransferase [Mesorhizobium sp. M7A.F.Ca.MR.362.00.0.0]
MSKLRVLDLFSGIGGFSLGLERTGGFETVAFCEIEPFPRRVLAKHWPRVPIYEDVRELCADRLAADGIAMDVITGGFPCQDISLAGSGVGLDGERSGLWSEIARLAGELRPKFVILENVSALLGNGMGRVLGDLAALGYDAEWHCIQASRVGAPHDRDRVWIVAHCDEIGRLFSGQYPDREHALQIRRQWHTSPPDTGWRDVQRWFSSLVQDGYGRNPAGQANGMVDGLPEELDEIAAHGNSVIPAIPELIGRAILQARAA